MVKPKIFADKLLPIEVSNYLQQHVDLTMWEHTEPIPRDQLLEKVTQVQGLMTANTLINEQLLNKAVNLKIISTISVGYNHFDLDAMRDKSVVGTHTPYVLDDTVADLVLSLMLCAARRIPELDAMTKQGKWGEVYDNVHFGVDVHHKTLGIIGMGRIGEAIIKRAKHGFDMNVLYHNRNRKVDAEQKWGIAYKSLEDLLKQSDFVVLMVPLSKETNEMIGREQFAMMKNDAIFINASRGQTVNERDMIEALQLGQIRAAGLDVYQQEPIQSNNPLLQMTNVITLPHIGSATAETRLAMAMLAAQNVVHYFTKKDPIYVVKELQSLNN